MRSPLVALIALVFPVFAAVAAPAATDPVSRREYNLNLGWRLCVGDPAGAEKPAFDDFAWKAISLPHAWNEDDAFRKDIADLSTGVAWYRKHFTLPPGAVGNKVFLEFEGARQAAEVWVNGQRVGLSENGVMAFGFDLSKVVVAGDNVVAVRTDNAWDYRERATGQRFQWNDHNFNANYGGLPKNVRLHITGLLYQTLPLYSSLGTTGVYVYATDFDIPNRSAKVTVESEVRNDSDKTIHYSYLVEIHDAQGQRVASFLLPNLQLRPGNTAVAGTFGLVKGLHFWSWGYGYLYDVVSSLIVDGRMVDVVHTRTGFRKTEFGQGMIRLNDRVIQVHGYAQRTTNEWPAVGSAVPPWLSDFSNRLMVESNANLVRWMHVTPWKQDVESCDRVGLLEAMPAGDSEGDVTGRRWEQRVAVMRDAMIYNRNNPSILFYEAGNRGVSEQHMREIAALRNQFDPHGGRAAGSREMMGSKVAEYGGEMLYVNKSARLPLWEMEYSRDEGLRKYWDNYSPPFHKDGDGPLYRGQSAAIYNRNQDSHAVEDVVRWYDYWRERPGTGRRVSSGGVNIVFSDTNTHHRGAENYRRSGEVDAMRIPKDGFYANQVMWDGWVDVEKPRVHIIGHWNYAAGTVKPVYVVSSADRVVLYLNGQSLGAGRREAHFLHVFDRVAWQPGTLRAVGYDEAGAPVCEACLHTAGEPAALRLTAFNDPTGFRADGADLALVQVEVVDAHGQRCPTALNPVDFELDGPAEWRGGIAQGPDNCILSKTLPVECGVNRVLVRSTTEAGSIRLAARSPGLKAASLELNTVPIAVSGGLSPTMPADGLPSYLGRGPTPAGPSYRMTRRDVPVASATAGSNADQAALTFDDNETTKWVSAGGVDQAWISYDLARPATLREAVIKFAGWRQRSYPIRITVDGYEVFRGDTPKGYGYVTLPFKPVLGRTVRIELTGETTDKDALHLVEVSNQKIADTGANNVPASVLAIVEAEFYEAP